MCLQIFIKSHIFFKNINCFIRKMVCIEKLRSVLKANFLTVSHKYVVKITKMS